MHDRLLRKLLEPKFRALFIAVGRLFTNQLLKGKQALTLSGVPFCLIIGNPSSFNMRRRKDIVQLSDSLQSQMLRKSFQ